MVTVTNPILPGFYPDPSICRVGEEFYLVNSSFVYAPGVPIFHSRDLAHWEQIGNVLDRESQLSLEQQEISRGIFAPAIRYHKGLFYMITTNVSHGGNFIVTAEKPEGPWSDPYYLGDEAIGIDPSLFFDEDDRCYYCGTRPNPNGVTYNGDWEIWVQEVDLSSMKLVGESMAIWKGALKNAIWPEGPHLYKKDGYYYLMHAEGGTGPEHSISVARSRKLFQWFEGCIRNPIFTHRNLGADYPVIYAGHGDLVDDGHGNWYVVMLASRPCKKHVSLGRETYLAKVIWEDGWPVIAPGVGHLEETLEIPLKEQRFSQEVSSTDVIRFWDEELDQRMVGISKRNAQTYTTTANPGMLRLFLQKEKISELGNCGYLGIRQKGYCFTADTGILFTPGTAQESAGLVLYQNHENHLRMELVKGKSGTGFQVTACIHGMETLLSEVTISEVLPEACGKLLVIRLQCKEQRGNVWLECGKQKALVAENVDMLPYTTEEAGGFVGCTVGIYGSSNGTESDNYAEFGWLECQCN